jgi:6-phosphogluconolactonase
MHSAPEILNTPQFAADAADFILAQARHAIAARGFFRLALAGGQTPSSVYAQLAKRAGDLPWNRVQFTFGDERCVPPEHIDSNFRMAKDSLFDAIAGSGGAGSSLEGNIFRVRGEIDPEQAAQEYEKKLGTIAGRLGESIYTHDLVLLGLGPDGHTASLFPGSPALEETARHLLPVIGPKPPPQRITMTFPLINAARHICFLVNDPGKKAVIDEILSGNSPYPAGRIQPTAGKLTWILGA